MNRIPKVKHVQAKDNFHLIIKFDNNLEKDYDCQQIIYRLEFKPLLNKAFFRSVKVDIGGYGIS